MIGKYVQDVHTRNFGECKERDQVLKTETAAAIYQ